VFLLLLCNDKAVLGPWTNPGWLNAIASLIVGVLVVLSAILTVTTLFPHVDVTQLTLWLFAALVAALAAAGGYIALSRRRAASLAPQATGAPGAVVARENWTM